MTEKVKTDFENAAFDENGKIEFHEFVPVKYDTASENILYSFEIEEFYFDREMEIPLLLKNVIWIDDDFMNDENIEFDYEAFDVIDSGEKYLNPKHFSVKALIDILKKK